MGTSSQNGVLTVGNETTPLLPDSLLGAFTKLSESRISEVIRMSDFQLRGVGGQTYLLLFSKL